VSQTLSTRVIKCDFITCGINIYSTTTAYTEFNQKYVSYSLLLQLCIFVYDNCKTNVLNFLMVFFFCCFARPEFVRNASNERIEQLLAKLAPSHTLLFWVSQELCFIPRANSNKTGKTVVVYTDKPLFLHASHSPGSFAKNGLVFEWSALPPRPIWKTPNCAQRGAPPTYAAVASHPPQTRQNRSGQAPAPPPALARPRHEDVHFQVHR